MKALVIEREVARFAAARVAGSLRPGGGSRVGPLALRELDPPERPTPEWIRLRPRMSGICGSDLATIDGRSSRWFEPIVSFPFVPGHEVVADDPDDRRVVVEPVLGCAAREISPRCQACADGHLGNCTNLAHGSLEAGLQTGYCCDAGGGWSTEMVAHPSQVHEVPDELSDRDAVMIEPTACAVHAALAAEVERDETVALIGAGTLGLGVAAALMRWSPPGRLIVAAKHPHQRDRIRDLCAPAEPRVQVCDPDELLRAVRRDVGTMMLGGRLTGGAQVTIDCVGSTASIHDALAVTRPGGRIVLVGMPSRESVDLTPLWQREISLLGAYAYGTETIEGSRHRTFELAAELVAAAALGSHVDATYPLERFGDAIEHAAGAGRRGVTKVAFDLHDPDHPPAPILRGRR